MPELQEKKDEIVQGNARSAVILRDIEDRILEGLTKHDNIAAILETDELIDILSESKQTSQEISERQEESEVTEKEID